ncbi:hypothetical protein HK097_011064 [Rhizophlyctis rosea]|uniref:Uncharacterized protein n=1 Tax=Rhizophlyctis rosea TaxID=64517 RepID=A0AAD5SH36_9FUNG|nr:hypothetical protein HK097_011064 [Rhizophlyctis rosea]
MLLVKATWLHVKHLSITFRRAIDALCSAYRKDHLDIFKYLLTQAKKLDKWEYFMRMFDIIQDGEDGAEWVKVAYEYCPFHEEFIRQIFSLVKPKYLDWFGKPAGPLPTLLKMELDWVRERMWTYGGEEMDYQPYHPHFQWIADQGLEFTEENLRFALLGNSQNQQRPHAPYYGHPKLFNRLIRPYNVHTALKVAAGCGSGAGAHFAVAAGADIGFGDQAALKAAEEGKHSHCSEFLKEIGPPVVDED